MECLLLLILVPLLGHSSPTPKVLSSSANGGRDGSGFSCKGQPPGYYADLPSGCQKYHLCSVGGKQWTYSCPEGTLFQQGMTVCDHQHNVECVSDGDVIGALGHPPTHPNQIQPYKSSQGNYLLPRKPVGKTGVKRPAQPVEQRQRQPINQQSTSAPEPTMLLPEFSAPVKKITSIHVSVSPILDIEPEDLSINQAATSRRHPYLFKPKPSTADVAKQLNELASVEQAEAKSSERRSVIVGGGIKSRPFFPEGGIKPSKQRNVVIINEPPSLNEEGPISESLKNVPQSKEVVETSGSERESKVLEPKYPPAEDEVPSESKTISETTSSEEVIAAADRSSKQRIVAEATSSEEGVVAGDRRSAQRSVTLEEGKGSRLEWTLPDVRAMLYIPDREEDAVEPNIKRYSVTVPSKRHTHSVMQFRPAAAAAACPSHCDVRFLAPGLCNPCISVK